MDEQRTTNLVLTGIGLIATVALILGIVGVASDGDTAADGQPGPQAAPAETFSPEPARSPTIEEISRHPATMPDSADYTRYEDGQWSQRVERDGPITQEVHFEIQEGVAEVLPGTTLDLWTFDGTVPGPMIRTRVGDTVDFFLHNPEDSQLPHNVDFHAVTGPGGGAATLDTAPGATSELSVKMLNPGIYIYHCAWPDIPSHIAHGMYGLIVVEPEGGLDPVDHEYYVMQSEYYTAAGGSSNASQLEGLGHLPYDGSFGNLEEPTFVNFNGRPDALNGERALGVHDEQIAAGDSVRMFVGNIGPNLISSFHVIGEIFDTVYVEGSFDLTNQDVQSTAIPVGGAAGVEFAVEVPGDYLLVDHSIFRTHKGALGTLRVEGDAQPEIYDPRGYSSELRSGE